MSDKSKELIREEELIILEKIKKKITGQIQQNEYDLFLKHLSESTNHKNQQTQDVSD